MAPHNWGSRLSSLSKSVFSMSDAGISSPQDRDSGREYGCQGQARSQSMDWSPRGWSETMSVPVASDLVVSVEAELRKWSWEYSEANTLKAPK